MWIANLSDGTILTEEDVKLEPGGPSPWRYLIKRCQDGEVKLTGLRLGVGPALVNALPTKQCDGYFHAYESIRYLFNTEVERKKQGIGSVVGEQVFITWMEQGQNGLTYIWQEVRPLKDCIQHVILS